MSAPKLGIRMDGTEERFINLVLDRARAVSPGTFSLFELGTAEGITFSALCKVMVDNGLGDSTMVSCDLPPGQSWSTDSAKLTAGMNRSGMLWAVYEHEMPAPRRGAQVYLTDGRALITHLHSQYGFSPDFVFIDGCHGEPCLVKDFLAVEPTVKAGAIVVFHDAGELEQGTDMQNHCGQYINVRRGLKNLGLLSGSREGWKVLEEIPGDRRTGGEGNSCFCIVKV